MLVITRGYHQLSSPTVPLDARHSCSPAAPDRTTAMAFPTSAAAAVVGGEAREGSAACCAAWESCYIPIVLSPLLNTEYLSSPGMKTSNNYQTRISQGVLNIRGKGSVRVWKS